VSGLLRVTAPPRARVLAALAGLLAALPDPLHPLVEQVAGLDADIDLVARDGRGRAVAVRLAAAGEDLAALGDLLAQCDWLRPRLRDWLKLNPGLGVQPELGVRGLLLAAEFDPRTLAAARSMSADEMSLARVGAFEWQGGLQLALEPLPLGRRAAPAAPPGPSLAPPAPLAEPIADPHAARLALAELGPEVAAFDSRFRTSLRDDELGLPRRPRSAPRG
jgi:hypothetical protein